MKVYLVIFSSLILASCGPNQQEKEEIAIIACNIMGESRNMESAMRIREVNSAREEIGEKRFLGTDEAIKEAFKYGLCKELVLNDLGYTAKLSDAIETEKRIIRAAEEREEAERIALIERAEAELIARQKREEAERIAKEERAEQERIAKEERAEQERIAKEERAEQERIAKEEIAEQERIASEIVNTKFQQNFTNSILSVFEDYPPSFSSGNITRQDFSSDKSYIPSLYDVEFGCMNSSGLYLKVAIQFEGDMGTIEATDPISNCLNGRGSTMFKKSDLSGELLDLYNESLSAFFSKVQKITIEWTGRVYRLNYEKNFSDSRLKTELTGKLDRSNFGGVDPDLTQLPHFWVVYER